MQLFLDTKNKKRCMLYLGFGIVFFMLLMLNLLQPIFTDDWEYVFQARLYNLDEKEIVSNLRISSFSDILKSQYEHYFAWGGRSVCHAIAQFLLLIGQPYNKILNSLAFVLLTYFIYLFCLKERSEIKPLLYLFINLLLFFSVPELGSSVLWITGSANYLWGILILLMFLYPYKIFLLENHSSVTKNNWAKSIYLLCGGIIAGWTNENTVSAAVVMLLGYLVYLSFVKKRKQPLWFYTGILGLFIGFCFMIMAPGNYVRMQVSLAQAGLNDASKFTILLEQFITAVSGLFFLISPLLVGYVLILVLYKHWGVDKSKGAIASLTFAILGALSTLAMTFASAFPSRAWFGIIVFFIIAIGQIANRLDFTVGFLKDARMLFFGVFSIMLVGYYISGYKDLERTKKIMDVREKIILEGKRDGISDFSFQYSIRSKSRINNNYDLTNDPNHWTNCYYARYYGIKSVTVIRSEYNKSE